MARLLVACSVAFGLIVVGTASAQPSSPPEVQPSLVVEATVLEVQTAAPWCGDLAVAGWARIRVDAIRTPVGGHVPGELTVMVQCPETFAVGERRRFDLVAPRPTRGHWTMFSTVPSSPPRTASHFALRAPPLP